MNAIESQHPELTQRAGGSYNQVSESGIAHDDVAEILDYSHQTLAALVRRLEQSHRLQELVSREIELDELWRRVDTALKAAREDRAGRARVEVLQALFSSVSEAHDLAGAGKPLEAAAALQRALDRR